jgi:hypothetical protein
MFARKACVLAAACGALTVGTSAQTALDIDTLLARVAGRIEQYYKLAQNVMCIEKTTVMRLGHNFETVGFHRVTEAELRVESDSANRDANRDGSKDGSAAPTFVRQLLKINGRAPRDKDMKDRSACLDPNPLTPEPLAFLLPTRREGYTFTSAGFGKGKDSAALVIEYTRAGSRRSELIDDPRGREDCFETSAPLAVKGRVLVDGTNYDVLRIEEHLAGLGELRTSRMQQRTHNFSPSIVVDRVDVTTRYKVVSFKDPEETFLLPESIETLEMFRAELQSHRTRQEFSNYRRFVTGGRVVK